MSSALQQAYAHCAEATRHYENFPVGSLLVPRAMRPAVHAVYAFARGADDIADEGGKAPDERIRLLDQWERDFDSALAGNDTGPVFLALADSIARFSIPPQLFRDLLSAFRQDVTVKRYATFADVRDYCRRSADPVGRIILCIAGAFNDTTAGLSDNICTALQLTNFWQDIAIDWEKGRVYIPAEDMERFGVTTDSLAARRPTDAFRNLMMFEIDRTDALFAAGGSLPRLLRGRLRIEIAATILGGRAILYGIRKLNFDVWGKRPRLSRFAMAGIVLRAILTRSSGV